MSLRVRKLLFVVLLSVASAGANASPTATTDNVFVPTVQTESDTPAIIAPAKEVIGPINSELANLGAEFLQPPASYAALGNAQDNNIKSLPAGPAALFMVLSGFLCVSLVRDRRVWLAVLAGLLWAGQTGIQALPQLALRLSRQNNSQQQFSAELTYPYYLENSNRLRSDIEGTQYIGLLHHLAGIPDSTKPLPSLARASSLRAKRSNLNLRNNLLAQQSSDKFRPPQFAIINLLSCLFSTFNCLASRAEQFICFSPAFIFENLPRGPPILA